MDEKKQIKRKLTTEEKKFQTEQLKTALSNLNLQKVETEISLKRIDKHLKLNIPMLELKDLLEKNIKMLDEDLLKSEKLKLKVEIELMKEEIKKELPILRAEENVSQQKNKLSKINKEIKSVLSLMKNFR